MTVLNSLFACFVCARCTPTTLESSCSSFSSASHSKERLFVEEETWGQLGSCLAEAVLCIGDGDFKRLHEPLGDCFRFLRNTCAGQVENAERVVRQPELVSNVVRLLGHLTNTHRDSPSPDCLSTLRRGVQFLGNLVSCCDAAKDPVWEATFVEKPYLYGSLLGSEDDRVRLYSSMLLYNCLSPEKSLSLLASTESAEVVGKLADMLAEADSEWSLFTLELLVQCDLFCHLYPQLGPRCRCIILDLLTEKLGRSEAADSTIPESLLDHLCERFRSRVMDIVKMVQPEQMQGDWDPVEIGKLLAVLCSASIHESLSLRLKEKESVLEMAVDILKTVHFLGKSEKNVFSSVQRLDDLAEVQDGSSDLAHHPAFGFKRGLVRLVGNMCHSCRRNQDLVREMDGIPVILDACNLDARNPYIIQWAVLAVRNLLEGNQENQAIVAGLVRTGVVADGPVLEQMGIRVERS